MMLVSFLLLGLSALSVQGLEPVLSIHGSGTTNPSKCYWHVMDLIESRAKLPMHMTYRGIGSSSGMAEFSNGQKITYFGSGDIPLTKEIYDSLSATETILQIPIFVGAVSFFHNVPDTPTLNLTACNIAKIMTRQITQWDDPEIKNDNPQLKVPTGGLPIRVARRVDGSSSTSGVTKYLANACPTVWDPNNVGSTVDWPEDTLECQGSGGVTDCIKEAPGSIGYLDISHGHGALLEEVSLENRDKTKLTSVQARARGGIAAAADGAGLPSSPSQDYSDVSLTYQSGEFTWPISAMTYIWVRQDLSFIQAPQEQALLKAFLEALFDESYVQKCVDDYEFSMVEGTAKELALQAINALQINSTATQFKFEESTLLQDGQGDYFISAKRSSAIEVELEVLNAENNALQVQVNELQSLLQDTRLQISNMGGSISTTSTGDSGAPSLMTSQEALLEEVMEANDKQDGDIAAALALSIISIILSLVCLAMFVCRSCTGKHQDPNMS